MGARGSANGEKTPRQPKSTSRQNANDLNDRANAKAMGDIWIYTLRLAGRKKLKVVLLLEEIIQHLRQCPFSSPSVFQFPH